MKELIDNWMGQTVANGGNLLSTRRLLFALMCALAVLTGLAEVWLMLIYCRGNIAIVGFSLFRYLLCNCVAGGGDACGNRRRRVGRE